MSQEHLKKAISCKEEKLLNGSFNFYQINNPYKSFFTQKYIQLFNQEDNSLIKKKFDFYNKFAEFLTEKLKLDGLFIRDEKNVFEYFYNKAKYWNLVDQQIISDVDTRYFYILKKFIIDSIDGLITEEIFYRKIKNIYKFNILKSSPEEDANMCVDFFIYINNIKCGFQIKPKTFFYGIKSGITKNSLNKIYSASKKYKIPIFLVFIENNKIYFVIRDKNKEQCNVVLEENFFKIFSIKITENTLFNLSKESFDKIEKKIIYTPS